MLQSTFETFYISVKPRMISIAKKILRDKDMAEDVVEDTLIQTLTYSNKNPDNELSKNIAYRNLKRACYLENKRKREVTNYEKTV